MLKCFKSARSWIGIIPCAILPTAQQLTQSNTAVHASLSHCITWVVIKPQLQGCIGTRQFTLMKYRLVVAEVKEVDIHLEEVWANTTLSSCTTKAVSPNFNLGKTILNLIYDDICIFFLNYN